MDNALFQAFKTAKILGCSVTVKQDTTKLMGGYYDVEVTTHNKELDPIFYHAELTSHSPVLAAGLSEVVLDENIVSALGKKNSELGFLISQRSDGITVQSGNVLIKVDKQEASLMNGEVGGNQLHVADADSGLCEAIFQCLPFAAKDTCKSLLKAVCVRNTGKNCYVLATDRYRLNKVDILAAIGATAQDCVIDADVIKLIKRLGWKRFSLTKGDNNFGTIVNTENDMIETLIFKFVQGKYPNEKVIVRDSDKDKYKVYFDDLDYLISTIQKTIDLTQVSAAIQFQWKKHRIGVLTGLGCYDKAGVKIEFSTNKKAIPKDDLTVNPHYLMGILKSFKAAGSKKVRISFNSNLGAVSIRDVPVPITADAYLISMRA